MHDPNEITAEDTAALIDLLVDRPVLADACDGLGLSLFAVHKRMSADLEFKTDIEAALAAGASRLEARAFQRANGEDKELKTLHGRPLTRINPDTGETENVYEIHQSDRLLELMLRARMPEIYGNKAEIHHKGNTGALVIPLIEGQEQFEKMLEAIAEQAKEEMDQYDRAARLDAPTGQPDSLSQ